MTNRIARSAIMAVAAAGLVLALSTGGAVARGGSSGVTVIVNGDYRPAHRFSHHRFGHHRMHRFHSKAARFWRRHADHAVQTPSRRSAGNLLIDNFRRGATVLPGVSGQGAKAFHKPAFRTVPSAQATGPIVPSFAGIVTRRVEANGVVIFRGPIVQSFGAGQPHGSGGKLIVLSPSPAAKTIVVVPTRHD